MCEAVKEVSLHFLLNLINVFRSPKTISKNIAICLKALANVIYGLRGFE